ncbi:DnaJ like protein subfamily C member 24 [Dufourea novaeangliae]|uniref:DnaJ like protein subfamily C member 24 n=2 Tax=Dufourea novaeangliae TaxID=178035 RepID=A0A154P0D5_DUFNO|nr:DnaJ like protein subfamily C member 24 [Dufourea novaeangliae]
MDYYDILGCTEESTTEDIKRAYHALALKFHPDKNAFELDGVQFQRITEAWNVLRDPKSRKEYDVTRKQVDLDSDSGVIHARISINELETIYDNEDTFVYRCRCGGLYYVRKEYIQEKDQLVHVPCLECTFVIVVET